jgi:hypothetical protein
LDGADNSSHKKEEGEEVIGGQADGTKPRGKLKGDVELITP